MTNLEWIRTLSAKELSDLLYDYWLPRGQYVWTDSRKGLVKMLGETYLERDCDKCKHQGNCYCVKGLGCPFEPKTDPSNSEKPNNCECEPRKEQNFCGKCRCLYRDFKYGLSCYRLMNNEPCKYEARKTEDSSMVDKDINVRSKDEPQTERSSE